MFKVIWNVRKNGVWTEYSTDMMPVNTEGLKRRGYNAEQIQQVRRAYRVLYRSGLPLEEAKAQLAEMADGHEEVQPWVDFLDTTVKSFIR